MHKKPQIFTWKFKKKISRGGHPLPRAGYTLPTHFPWPLHFFSLLIIWACLFLPSYIRIMSYPFQAPCIWYVGQGRQSGEDGRRPTRRWSEEELEILRQEFGDLDRPPTFDSIRHVQTLCPSLQSRTLAQIKTRAWELIRHWDMACVLDVLDRSRIF